MIKIIQERWLKSGRRAIDWQESVVYYVFISTCFSDFKGKIWKKEKNRSMVETGRFKKISRFWKINYDNIKKILILQPAQLSNSLQSYLKTVP